MVSVIILHCIYFIVGSESNCSSKDANVEDSGCEVSSYGSTEKIINAEKSGQASNWAKPFKHIQQIQKLLPGVILEKDCC